jgi:hypothetical protein
VHERIEAEPRTLPLADCGGRVGALELVRLAFLVVLRLLRVFIAGLLWIRCWRHRRLDFGRFLCDWRVRGGWRGLCRGCGSFRRWRSRLGVRCDRRRRHFGRRWRRGRRSWLWRRRRMRLYSWMRRSSRTGSTGWLGRACWWRRRMGRDSRNWLARRWCRGRRYRRVGCGGGLHLDGLSGR